MLKTLLLAIVMLVTACTPAFAGQSSPEKYGLHEELLWIPANIHGRLYQLQATLFRPKSTGKFPLIVINHGTQGGVPGWKQPRYRPLAVCAELVHEGYAVVLPMRRGYAESQGEMVQLHRWDLTDYGLENALDVKASIQWLKTRSFVDPTRIFVFGQSTGGLATMAYLSMADQGVLAGVNMHGGMRPHNLVSDPLLDARVTAFATYARSTRVPSLWIYTANDHSSRPPFISKLHYAYQESGGKAELHQLPAFKGDGHTLFGDPDGIPIWAPIVGKFLRAF